MLGPVAAGLAGTVAPAFGLLPALDGTALSLDPWRDLLATPGIGASIRLSLGVGLVSTALSLALTLGLVAAFQGTRAFRWIERALSPLLSVPHAAAAFGLAFLIAPSGWVARALSPWASGWERPPDVLIVGDPAGLSLVAGLVAKEVPFLLLMTLAALAQADARRARLVGLALGYGPLTAWAKGVLPAIYPQIRLPVFAVLAFSMSVVDVAQILGPSTPPPLSVRLVEWMRDPDLDLRFRAAAGALLQVGLVALALGLWRLGEVALACAGRAWTEAGWRHGADRAVGLALGGLGLGAALSTALGLAGLALWSVAGFWRFPDALPDGLTTRIWTRAAPGLAEATATTALIGAAAALIALVLAALCLETEFRRAAPEAAGRRVAETRALWLLYLPLLVPQTGFLFGLQIAAGTLGVPPGLGAVIAAHLVFVLPYVFLSLSGPWRAWDARQALAARCLGASPARVLQAVRLPMLLAPLLTAFAVGFAVSVGQYLPTLLIGAGRVATLTTEAVALAAGGDRRLIGAWALVQAAAPLPVFLAALGLPALVWRRRRGMTVTR
ncbi:MAG: ABC transporter permease [Paracoccaceae bacterium]